MYLPKIAIITPVFNLVKEGRINFIKQNIESIHNQTYKNIEHIIQDGASTDGTVEFLKEYADKGWIKLYSEKDKNLYDAFNRAIKKTTAEYCACLGSDDYYRDNDIVEYIVNNYLQDETIDYIYGDEEHISFEKGEYIKTWYGNAHENEFWRGVCYGTYSIIFSKRVFNEILEFDLNYPICADLKFQMLLKFKDYKPAYCNRVINVFREGAGLSSNQDTLFYHTKEFAEICSKLWSKFDETITPEKAELMLKYHDYDELFLLKLRNFVINKKLKNIDYIAFNKYIENMIASYYSRMENKELTYQKGEKKEYQSLQDIKNQLIASDTLMVNCKDDLKNTLQTIQNGIKQEKFVNKKIVSFLGIPVIKIVEKINCKRFYFLCIIPILKIWTK